MNNAAWKAQTSVGNIRVNKVSNIIDGSKTINNMPPYITVYIWKRTA